MVPDQPGVHPEDLKAALRKAGWTYRKLAEALGVSQRTVLDTIHRGKSPKVCLFIGSLLSMEPYQIWPARYEIVRIRRRAMI